MDIAKRFERFRGKRTELEGLFKRLARGQSPWAMVVSCSDSRVVPELIFDAKPGELFVVRNIANIVPPYDLSLPCTAAAVEYAVKHLKVQKLVVLGHSDCGGIKTILGGKELEGHLSAWLALRMERLKGLFSLREAEIENVRLSVKELLNYPFVREAAEAGKLSVEGYYYILDEFRLERV